MAYEKQTWATGDTITAQKLNHMEDGIGDFVVTFNVTGTPGTLAATFDKTLSEIIEAFNSGKHIVGYIQSWNLVLGLENRFIQLKQADVGESFASFIFEDFYPGASEEIGKVTLVNPSIEIGIEDEEEYCEVFCPLYLVSYSNGTYPSD